MHDPRPAVVTRFACIGDMVFTTPLLAVVGAPSPDAPNLVGFRGT